MDLSPGTLFANLLFGAIGFAAWRYGRKRESARAMLLGAALIIYPWLVEGPLALWGIGAALTILVFFP